MIAALAFDVFVQQMVEYPLRNIEIGDASIGRAQSYEDRASKAQLHVIY